MSKKKVAQEMEKGDLVYFNGYNREVDDKLIRPGSQAEIVDLWETESGDIAYRIETKKGVVDDVFADEIRLRESKRISPEAAKKALKANNEDLSEKVKPNPVEYFNAAEEQDMIDLLRGQGKDDNYDLIINEELQAEFKSGDHALAIAKRYMNLANKAWFQLGGAFAKIYYDRDYQNYKDVNGDYYRSFNAFIEGEFKKHFSWRTARYFMEIYIKFTNWGITLEEIGDLGWSKAKQITPYADRTTIRELMAIADQGGDVLKRYIESKFKSKEGVKEEEVPLGNQVIGKFKHYKFSFLEDQDETVKIAFEHIKQINPELDESKPSQVMMAVLSDYVQNIQQDGQAMTLEQYIQYGQGLFPNKDILALDRQTQEVISTRYEFGQVNVSIQAPQTNEEVELVQTI